MATPEKTAMMLPERDRHVQEQAAKGRQQDQEMGKFRKEFAKACAETARAREQARLKCHCGCEKFYVTKVDFVCTACERSYRD